MLLVALAVVCFAATVGYHAVEPSGTLESILGALNTHNEGNLVTWISSAILAAGGVLCVRMGRAERSAGPPARLGWVLLGALLVAFAVDEVAQLHERSVRPVVDLAEAATGESGTLTRVVAAALAAAGGVAVFAVAIPWLRRLPRRTARLLILAGAVYFGGAFGLEIAGRMLETSGLEEGVVEVLPSIEELAEMTGSALLVYAVWPRPLGG